MISLLYSLFFISLVKSDYVQSGAGPDSYYIPKSQLTADNFMTMKPVHRYVNCFNATDNDSIFKYSVKSMNKSEPEIKFSDFKDKLIMVVNVATFCGVATNLPEMNDLVKQFGEKLQIVAFPCDQFGNQEPAKDDVKYFNGLKYVFPGNGFVPEFKVAEKVQVNGPQSHPIFSFLKRSCPPTRSSFFPLDQLLLYTQRTSRDVRWNFEKFLVCGKTGQVMRRYDTHTPPRDMVNDIKDILDNVAKI